MKLSFKLFEIAAHTYRQHVARRSFIFFAFLAPLLGALLFCGVAVWLTSSSANFFTLGWVDESRLFSTAPSSARFRLQRFDSANAAEQAWRAGTLDGYFVVPRDYLQTGSVQLVARFEVTPFLRAYAERFLRAGLLEQSAPDVRTRILDGIQITHAALQTDNSSRGERVLGILIAGGLISLLFLLNQFTSNYLRQALQQEHENRTFEIILTSVSMGDFFVGKVLGIALTGLTPVFVWGALFGLGVGAIFFALMAAGVIFEIHASVYLLGVGILLLVPSYVVGALTTISFSILYDGFAQEQWLPWLLDLAQALLLIPLLGIALATPTSPVAVGLSLLPWTSAVVLLLRLGLTDVPLWQVLGALVLAWGAGGGLIWFCARLYQATRGGNFSWRVLLGK